SPRGAAGGAAWTRRPIGERGLPSGRALRDGDRGHGRGARARSVPPGADPRDVRHGDGPGLLRAPGAGRLPVGDRHLDGWVAADGAPGAPEDPLVRARGGRVSQRGRLLLFLPPAAGLLALLVDGLVRLPRLVGYPGP